MASAISEALIRHHASPKGDATRRKISDAGVRYWANLSPDEREARGRKLSEAALRYWASLSPEERSARGRKAAATAKENGNGHGSQYNSAVPHGTCGGYTNYRCRCHRCRFAMSEYHRKRREAQGIPDD